jgi:transcription elongation factor/antiterminator RfaH
MELCSEMGYPPALGGGLLMNSSARRPLALVGRERWFLVHTLPNSEGRAEVHLRAQGFGTYLPQINRTIRHARRFRNVQAPLFPRYMFLILDLSRDRWLSVRSTIGVSTLVTCEDRPIPVPAGVVEDLISSYDQTAEGVDCGLAKGQSVRIVSGPFAELIGTLDRLDARGRTRVLLEIMSTSVPVAIHRQALCPAA